MLIANPIYDVVFKYLMVNVEIAKGVISTIIGEEIVTLDFKAQEQVLKIKNAALKGLSIKELTYFHLDFIAKIRLKEGGYKNILIELQKSNLPYDIERFRKYLGAQYQRVDDIPAPDNTSSKDSLPIITIYFLGFNLSKTLPSVIKVNREYIDVLGGKKIVERNEFIERLTHDAFVIQIPLLHVSLKTRLERILSVFQQEHFIDGSRHLKSYEFQTEDVLMAKILRQLEKAAADEDLHRLLELEEMALSEYESTFTEMEKKFAKQNQALAQKDQVIELTTKELEQKAQVIEQKDQVIERKDEALAQTAKELEQKDKYIKELLEKLNKSGNS